MFTYIYYMYMRPFIFLKLHWFPINMICFLILGYEGKVLLFKTPHHHRQFINFLSDRTYVFHVVHGQVWAPICQLSVRHPQWHAHCLQASDMIH